MKTNSSSRISPYEIRADYNSDTIVVYQAFPHDIADAALGAATFIAPFSLRRMTWIKPSFLWLMERSNWGMKPGQERILGVRMRRSGWNEALSEAVLTNPVTKIHGSAENWHRLFGAARVHVQWDPDRSLRGEAQARYAIQVGISRHLIERYVDEWVVQITDRTPVVRKMRTLIQSGNAVKARAFLPEERIYNVHSETASRLGIGTL